MAEAAKMNETWAFYPDDEPLRTLALQGDSRAALTPFLAHKCACMQCHIILQNVHVQHFDHRACNCNLQVSARALSLCLLCICMKA